MQNSRIRLFSWWKLPQTTCEKITKLGDFHAGNYHKQLVKKRNGYNVIKKFANSLVNLRTHFFHQHVISLDFISMKAIL